MQDCYYATGRRKEAVARVRLFKGEGRIIINGEPIEKYFKINRIRLLIKQPFIITENKDKFDVKATVSGGGFSGQAGAIQLGISRALIKFDENLKPVLRKYGFLTRNPKEKERKKYGRKRARKRFQYSKR